MGMIPMGDDNSDRTITPYVNYLLIAANIVVFVLLQNFAIDLIDRERFNLVIGVVFLVIVLFSPDGLLGWWDRLRELVTRRMAQARTTASGSEWRSVGVSQARPVGRP